MGKHVFRPGRGALQPSRWDRANPGVVDSEQQRVLRCLGGEAKSRFSSRLLNLAGLKLIRDPSNNPLAIGA